MTHKFFYRKPADKKIKPKPTIQRINMTPESSETPILTSSKISHGRKKPAASMPGYCCICGNTATHIAKYIMTDATLIERYCDVCVVKIV